MRNRSGMNHSHNNSNSESHRRCLRSRSISNSENNDEGITTAAASDDDDGNNEDVELRSLLSGDEGDGGGSSLSPLNNPRRPLDKQHLITHLTAATIASSSSSSSTNENEINSISSRRNKCIPRCSAMALFLFIIFVGIMFLGMGGPLLDHASNNRSSSLSSTTSLWAPSSNNNNNNNRHGDKHHHLSNYGNANNNDDGDSNNMKRMPYRMVDYANTEDTAEEQQHTWKNWFGKKKADTTTTTTGKKKFDRINDTKKQQGSMTKIKEAIDNLDRVFMDKHPDAQQQQQQQEEEDKDGGGDDMKKNEKKKKKRQQQQQRGGDAKLEDGVDVGADDDSVDSTLADSDTTNNNGGGGGGGGEESTIVIGGVPLVHDAEDDDALNANADALDAYARTLPASDALECRASVVAFVINATDVKDECDGLRKAFDKACSVQAQTQSQQQPNLVRQRRILQKRSARRRVLSEWGRPQVSNLIPEAFHGYLQTWMVGHKVGIEVTRRLANSWLDFSDGDVDTKALRGGVEWRRLEGIYVEDEEVEGGVVEDELDDESSTALQQEEKKQDPAVVVPPPIISLNIPTENEHLSEQMLNDALLLQDTEMLQAGAVAMAATPPISVVDSPPDQILSKQQQPSQTSLNSAISGDSAANPYNNVTVDTQVAVQDAAESAEAIRTAVEGVKSMMNDPKSVEARTCCASILSVFHEHCDPTTKGVEDYSDQRLLVVVFVITVCGIIKSMIRHLNIRWLPEAGGCILVGVFGYLILQRMPHVRFAFDGDMFLRIMVPPIVFEAAVKINKQSFRRHVIPITIFAIVGTLASTAFTAFILHKGSSMFGGYVPTIPPRESLIFGALISSIDPIAVLSVLSNMGMTDSDTIYVLIFGESLLNDGVAIVLFQTLVHFLDESLVIDSDVVLDATIHFVVVALGSISVGIASGVCATLYFSLMHGCQTPMVEVIVFCCFSFIPYYICDLVEWSGIVAIVANGFVMDLYVIGQTHMKQPHQHAVAASSTVDSEIDFLVNGTSSTSNGTPSRRYKQQQCRSAFTYEGHLSPTADSHVHFVIEIFATLMETAIFAYLGLFLFSSRYHWNGYLTVLSIFATVMGRVLMIPILSHVANVLNRMRVSRQRQRYPPGSVANINDEVHIDRRMQLVLVFAGLRGAMSFALVEHIPMFDTTTGQGSRLKPELKAMTSASVIFTLFILGGATSYLMERLGYSLNMQQGQQNSVEIVSLLQNHEKRTPTATERKSNGVFPQANDIGLRTNGKVRQRGSNK